MTQEHTNGDTLRHEVELGIKRGWRFTPLNGKRPIKPAWQETDVDVAEILAHAGSGGNVGLRTGQPSGIVVVDCDDGAPSPKELVLCQPLIDGYLMVFLPMG